MYLLQWLPSYPIRMPLVDLVGDLRCAHPCIGVKPLLAKLREQQPELEAGCKEVREALSALHVQAQSEAKAALPLPNANEGDHRDARVATPVGVCALSDDALGVVFEGLRNVLEPRAAVDFGLVSKELWYSTLAPRQQLRADHEAAAALCHKLATSATSATPWVRSCKELREAKMLDCQCKDSRLSATDLATLGTLGLVLPALRVLHLSGEAQREFSTGAASPDGVQRLLAGLGAGALPAVTYLSFGGMHVGDAGASALAAALDRGALPRLENLVLSWAAIGDAGLVALAPALRQRPALARLGLERNPLGDEGIAALVAPPPPAGAQRTTTGALTKLTVLYLSHTQITDAGCATLASALDNGALPALVKLPLRDIPASDSAIGATESAVYKCASVAGGFAST